VKKKEIIEEAFNWVRNSEIRLGQFASNEIAWRDIVAKALEIQSSLIFRDLENLYKKYEEEGTPPVICLPEDCGELKGISAVEEYWEIKKRYK
jgi:hypothetical protein